MSDFPQYRKLSNSKSFYCIEDDRNFIEIQLIGNRAFKIKIHATQYPEIIKIQEMLACEAPYLQSAEQEFEEYNLRNK